MEIIIKLERDQARTVQQKFFPYCEQFCISKRNIAVTEDERLMYMILASVFNQVQKQFNKKLAGDGLRFRLKFSNAEGITLYKLLIAFPIKSDQVYMINLRQRITDSIHKQLATIETMMYEKKSLQE